MLFMLARNGHQSTTPKEKMSEGNEHSCPELASLMVRACQIRQDKPHTDLAKLEEFALIG